MTPAASSFDRLPSSVVVRLEPFSASPTSSPGGPTLATISWSFARPASLLASLGSRRTARRRRTAFPSCPVCPRSSSRLYRGFSTPGFAAQRISHEPMSKIALLRPFVAFTPHRTCLQPRLRLSSSTPTRRTGFPAGLMIFAAAFTIVYGLRGYRRTWYTGAAMVSYNVGVLWEFTS